MRYRIVTFAVLLTLVGVALGVSLLSDQPPNADNATEKDGITGIRSVNDGTDGTDAPEPSIRGVTNASGSIR